MKTTKSSFFLVAFLAILIASCESSKSKPPIKVEYKGHSLQIPANWEHECEELAEGSSYQMFCDSKDDSHIFMLQWINTEFEAEEYLELMKNTLKEDKAYKKVNFSPNQTGMFHEHQTLYSDFKNSFLNLDISGRLTAFNIEDKTYLVMYYSDVDELGEVSHDTIMSSITLNGKKL